MFGRLVAWTVLVSALAPSANADEQFPYLARTTAPLVEVRSGPGDKYYPVLKLERGAVVEVVRRDADGWLAIRPPEGSFSWIAGEYLRAGADGVGEIIGDQVAVRVGSRLSEIRDVIQLRMNHGEKVEILDTVRGDAGQDTRTWYKVASPLGEFRWVPSGQLERTTAAVERAEPGATGNPLAAKILAAGEALTAAADGQAAKATGDRAGPTWRRSTGASDRRALATPTPLGAKTSTTSLRRELDDLELALSVIVADDPSVWNFDQLGARVEKALAAAETDDDRARARLLMNKVARFDDIRQRHVATMETPGAGATRTAVLPRPAATVVPPRYASTDTRFDGQGKLAEVMEARPGLPRFALLDEAGNVRCYVSPAPGVNLRSYLGRDVGIVGTLGYLPDQDKQHVTAKRIEMVDATRLR